MLQIETLEDRSVPATLFVITHGLQLNTDQVPDWMQDLAAAISRRLDLGVSADAIRASIQAYNAPTDAPNPGASDRFLIYNWAAVSGLTNPGTADDPAVAGRLADLVRARVRAAADRGEKFDIQFIGHSRGTIVTLAALNALNTPADDAAIGTVTMTLLDPQDYSTFNRSEAIPLVVPPNVDFAANYYQKVDPFTFGSIPGVRDDDRIMGGGVVTGALNVDLSDTVRTWIGRTDEFSEHSEARDWFHWTIDADDTDATTARYLDPFLNRQQDQFISQPDTQGRKLVFSQTIDRNGDGQADDLGLGRRTGFYYTLPASGGVLYNGGLPSAVSAGGLAGGSIAVFAPVGGLYDAGTVRSTPLTGGPVRVATADVTGDGVLDQVVGTGPGSSSQVVVLDGRTGTTAASFMAFEASFTGGVFVTAADLTGDGRAEIVVTPDRGGGPVVAVYTGAGAELTRFFGIEDRNFRGGARAAIGDLSGDGRADLVVAAGFGGGPRLALFDGRTVLTPVSDDRQPPKLLSDFYAFEDSLRNGAYVTAGDLTGDGAADLIVGGGPGGGPRVRAVDGRKLLAAPPRGLDEPSAAGMQLANFFAGDPNQRGGVPVAARDIDADGRADLVTASGAGEPARVRVYKSSAVLASRSVADQELPLFGGQVLGDGAFVG